MATQQLAPVFVDKQRVSLGGEPRPQVRIIVEAAGHNPESVRVMRFRGENDAEGTRLRLEDFIDRAAESNPVFLKCLEKGGTTGTTGETDAERAPAPSVAPGGRTPEETVPTEEPAVNPPPPERPGGPGPGGSDPRRAREGPAEQKRG